MAEIVLIDPRFQLSYWGMERGLPFLGKQAVLPTACLPLLAALTPPEHRLTVMDENVQPLDFDRIARADIVGLTGMSVQRFRMREILQELKGRGVFTVVGGPWVTVEEDYFGDLADVIFVGEAEDTWPQFLREWHARTHRRRYEQSERTDMSTVPCPRYDVLRAGRYLVGSVQFSRGCPFQCEFCDIIVTFGRRPRLKTSRQVIAELEALQRCRFNLAFIVDDNLIGNKKAVKELLRDVVAWQRTKGYPLRFVTEASLDLAEEDELIQLMIEANIVAVFIGIESPNEESLRETKKLQNIRAKGGTILDKVHKIQRLGLEVWCGMIVGFDHDRSDIFDAQVKFITEARIVHAMVGQLVAIPKTPLHARLAAEGRLDRTDPNEFGTNVIPLQMTREELSDGYVRIMRDLYEPQAYFDRVDSLLLDPDFRIGPAQAAYWRRHPWSRIKAQAAAAVGAVVLYHGLLRGVRDKGLREEYRRRMRNAWRVRRDPQVSIVYAVRCVLHYHYYTMVRLMTRRERVLVNNY